MKKSIVVFISLLILVALFLPAVRQSSGRPEPVKLWKKPMILQILPVLKYQTHCNSKSSMPIAYSVVVSAHENVFEHLDIHQSGNTLIIGMKFFPYNTFGTKITITMPQLSKLAVSGACDGTAIGFDSNNDLEISLSGASDLNTDLKAGKTKLGMSGEAKIIGDLTATDTQINLSGACDLNMILNTSR